MDTFSSVGMSYESGGETHDVLDLIDVSNTHADVKFMGDMSTKMRSGRSAARGYLFPATVFMISVLLMLAGYNLVLRNQSKLLSYQWRRVKPSEAQWKMPLFDEVEQSLSTDLLAGKAEISAVVNGISAEDRESLVNHGVVEGLNHLAKHLTGDPTADIKGTTLVVSDLITLGDEEAQQGSVGFKVTGILGEGGGSILLEAINLQTEQKVALKLSTSSRLMIPFPALSASIGSLKLDLDEGLILVKACGTSKPGDAAHTRGLFSPIQFGRILGIGNGYSVPGGGYILPKVRVMPLMKGDLRDFFGRGDSRGMASKIFASRSVLHEVLLLHRAGVCHNDLSLDNFLVGDDGSIFLNDLGSSTPIGTRALGRPKGKQAYKEPSLLDGSLKTRLKARFDGKNDMWSLGICLYQIFADGHAPPTDDDPLEQLDADMVGSADTIRVRSERIAGVLRDSGTPPMMIELICALLNPDRNLRPDASTVALKYGRIIQET